MSDPMRGKVCLVTGATSGIGRATALELAKRGARVVIVSRDYERGVGVQESIRAASGNPAIDLLVADLSSQAAIRLLVANFTEYYEHLHVLINNAAVVPARRRVSEDGIEMQLAVNHLAPFLLTNLLLNRLRESAPARVINISSHFHHNGVLNFNNLGAEKNYPLAGWAQYNNTKLMNLLFTYELARRLRGTGVTVNALHPGFIRTGLSRETPLHFPVNLFFASPERAARRVIYLASAPEVYNVSGKYFAGNIPVKSSPLSYSETAARKLWQISVALTGLDR